jgi:hypothetical protein
MGKGLAPMILYNPHVDDFMAAPPHFGLLKRKALKKYGFLISESIARNEKIRVLVDGSISAFIPESLFGRLPARLRSLIADSEFKAWLRLNGLGSHVERVKVPRKPVDEVLLAFSYKAATGPFHLRQALFRQFRHVVFHTSHYFVSTQEKARNLQALDNVVLAGDADISHNAYFQRFFPWYARPFLVLPFAVGERFAVRKAWQDRLPKAVATGTFHDLTLEIPRRKYEDFLSATGSDTYHPLRKAIFGQAASLDNIDSRISPYRPPEKHSALQKFIAHFWVGQKSYFAIDIVDLYNSYQFAVVGEELSGFPALGAFEALSCGCTLLGEPSAYSGTGLQANVHFIPHDGTLAGLQAAMKTQHRPDPEAVQSVLRTMAPAKVFERWQAQFLSLAQDAAR